MKRILCTALIAVIIAGPSYAFGQEITYLGNLSKLTDATGMPLHYSYDNLMNDGGHYLHASLDQQASEQDLYTPIPFDQLSCHTGKLCAKRLGNGDLTVYKYSYNAQTNPYQAISQKNIYQRNQQTHHYQLIAQITYRYNLNGQLIQTQTISWLNHKKYVTNTHNQYDILARLVAHQNTLYRYDANGNMINRIGGQASLELSINGTGQAISINNQSIHFDSNGNQLTAHAGGLGIYHFNARNQLVAYDSKRGLNDRYAYTANGLRWAKAQGNPSTTWQYYNQGAQLLNIITSAPNQAQTISHYLLAKGHLAQLLTGNHISHPMPLYNIVGHTGSVTGRLNSAGQLVGTTQYAAYGRPVQTDHTLATAPFGFDGEQQDADTGLINLRARNYS